MILFYNSTPHDFYLSDLLQEGLSMLKDTYLYPRFGNPEK